MKMPPVEPAKLERDIIEVLQTPNRPELEKNLQAAINANRARRGGCVSSDDWPW